MNYKVLYSRNRNFKNSTDSVDLYNIGNWRSRWERKRDLDKKKGFYINQIITKATPKDYIMTEAYGYDDNRKMYFKIVPDSTADKPKKQSAGGRRICGDFNSSRYGKYCKYR